MVDRYQGRSSRSSATVPLLTEGKRPKVWDRPLGTIDTLGLAVPLVSFETKGATASVSGLGTDQEQWRYRQALPSGGFMAMGVGSKAWIEASLPKRAGDDNVQALPLVEALEVAREMVREAETFFEPEPSHRFEASELVRLDAPRDFHGVGQIGALLDGLAGVPRDKRQKTRRWSDGDRNRAETLRVGPKAWGATLYDKHVESEGKAEPGHLRYEPRMHREQLTGQWAKDQGVIMRVIEDITEEKLSGLSRAVFDRVGFDREVSAAATVAERVFDPDNGLRWDVKGSLWAFLTAPAARAQLSKNTATKYRRLAADLGLAPVVEFADDEGLVVHLDFDRGTEVLRVAS